MKWILKRVQYRPDGIFGTLTSEDGLHVFTTLEHAYLVNGKWVPKVLAGIHPCILYNSPDHGYEVYLLNADSDKGHFYEVHIGNINANSLGCILIGTGKCLIGQNVQMITDSKIAFNQIMSLGVLQIGVFDATS